MAVSKSVKAQAKSKIKAKSTTRPRVKAKRTPGRPTQEDIADIEEKLLAVALQEFQAHGYGAASMTRIVTTAGMSKTTLYSRYPSKEHLFRAILKKQIQRYSPWASLDVDSVSPNLERGLKNYANRTLELSLKNDEVAVNHLIYTEINRFPELGEAAAERTAMGIERVAEFIRKCSQAEDMPCKDPQGIAEVFIHMLRGWYINVMLSNREVTEKQRKQWVNRAVKSLMLAREDW